MTKENLAVIHIAKKQLGMTDDNYRAMLSSFGVESSKDLTLEQFHLLMAAFQRLGFVNKSTKRTAPPRNREVNGVRAATSRQIWLIEKLWRVSGKVRDHSDSALENFIVRITKATKGTMTLSDASNVITAINKL